MPFDPDAGKPTAVAERVGKLRTDDALRSDGSTMEDAPRNAGVGSSGADTMACRTGSSARQSSFVARQAQAYFAERLRQDFLAQ